MLGLGVAARKSVGFKDTIEAARYGWLVGDFRSAELPLIVPVTDRVVL